MVLRCADDGRQDNGDSCRAALEVLCREYWPPLYSFARQRGYPPAEAQDIVQSFFFHLLETRAYAQADPNRGKFRTFLLGSLRNFMVNAHAHAHTRKRGGGQCFVPLDEHLAEAEAATLVADGTAQAADRVFEHRWAATVLAHAWKALRNETEARGQGKLLHALRPYLTAGADAPPSQTEVAARLGLPLATLRTHVHRLRERFRVALRAEVARTLPLEGDVDEELCHLRRALVSHAVETGTHA